jgi:hypothetical protein
MKWLVAIWVVLIAILFALKVEVRVRPVSVEAQVATPTATPTPTGPAMCTVTGNVVNADGSPFINGVITFNSKNIQVISGVPVNPTNVTTNTDTNGNLRAISLPQGLVVQITVCPPATGQGQPAVCSASYSAFIPFAASANFGQLSQGTALTPGGSLQLSSLQVTGQTQLLGGLQLGSPTGGNEGVGTINVATGYWLNGVDQFRTGTWTTVMGCSGGNPTFGGLSGNVGYWTTVGNMLFYQSGGTWGTSTGGSGNSQLQGLPYPAIDTTGDQGNLGWRGDVVISNASPSNAADTRILATVANGSSVVQLHETNFGSTGYLVPLPCANAWPNTPSGYWINGYYRYQ